MKTLTDQQGAVYQMITANDFDADGRLRLESTALQQLRKLPGGSQYDLQLEYAATQPITLQGYVSPTKPSSSRPLQGAGVSNGQLVLTGTGTLHLVLGGGYWTVQP